MLWGIKKSNFNYIISIRRVVMGILIKIIHAIIRLWVLKKYKLREFKYKLIYIPKIDK